jgi:hypothetical protein
VQKKTTESKVVSLQHVREEIAEIQKMEHVNKRASIEVLSNCLRLLSLNNLPELLHLKNHIKNVIRELKKDEKR